MENFLDIVLKQLVSVIIGGVATYLVSRYKAKADAAEQARIAVEEALERRNKAVEKGVQALLRNSILRLHHECVLAGKRGVRTSDNVEKMYESYTELDGNGTVKDAMEEFWELPLDN